MDVLRTPDERFEGLADWTFAPRYTEVTDADGTSLRIHHVDEGPKDQRPKPMRSGATARRPLATRSAMTLR